MQNGIDGAVMSSTIVLWPDTGGAGLNAAVPSVRWQQAEQFVVQLIGVFNELVGCLPTLTNQDSLYPGVHFEPPQEEEELLPGCLCVKVSVVNPGQILTDVNPKKPEAADSLHSSPVDVWRVREIASSVDLLVL